MLIWQRNTEWTKLIHHLLELGWVWKYHTFNSIFILHDGTHLHLSAALRLLCTEQLSYVCIPCSNDFSNDTHSIYLCVNRAFLKWKALSENSLDQLRFCEFCWVFSQRITTPCEKVASWIWENKITYKSVCNTLPLEFQNKCF